MTDRGPISGDWQAARTRADRRRERLGWIGAAATVAGVLAATTAWAIHAQRDGLDLGRNAIEINLEPPAAAPAATAVAPPAPDVPDLQAPEAPDLVEDTTPPPEDLAEDQPIDEIAEIDPLQDAAPDEVALPDAPAPPPPPPTVRPPPRPERVTEQPRREPDRPSSAPAPSQPQQAAPSATGQARQALSSGERQRLELQWGSQINARIQRQMRGGGRDQGVANVQIVVTPGGQMLSVALTRSSGSAALDQQILRAINAASRSFPAAPAGVTGNATFGFPIGARR
ncbi:TonB family protein [Falsirhodobacter halotolerans]|uniref:TonB family protein n=1 Tax=Falsirhodobacter halotolerans TaxID=1146892 RepID=UPI001FD42018|nr:TonB family protein [Falsirhodobacter halotolerans]MCJ8140739.1 TonB family protein [Falsirhodobacter halotolerans]